MGLIFSDACNLLALRKGRYGGRVVTLGRQKTYLHPSDVRKLRGMVSDEVSLRWLSTYVWGDFADGFFKHVLKFDAADSIDFSEYESATLIHDLGERLPTELHGQFDLVIDGGTLEHVFNFPVAIENVMKLAKLDGYIYINTPCNNLCGHGFYQFSPELMYRIFSIGNGFEVEFVRVAVADYLSVELTTNHAVFHVEDPDKVRARVHIMNSKPTMMMVLARCVAVRPLFEQKVLQSDYVATWDDTTAPTAGSSGIKRLVRRLFPRRWIDMVLSARATQAAKLGHGGPFQRLR